MPVLLRLREVAVRIGWEDSDAAARRVEATLTRAEKVSGETFLVRRGERVPTLVRWDKAQHYLPEPEGESAVERLHGRQWREFLERVYDRMTVIADQRADRKIDRRVMPELVRLKQADEKIAQAVHELAEVVDNWTKLDPPEPARAIEVEAPPKESHSRAEPDRSETGF